MQADNPLDITNLLVRWRSGDRVAESELITALYPVMKDIARSRLARSSAQVTLRATDLVHEAYERLSQGKNNQWNDRVHFLAVAANAIRNVVIDYLRSKEAAKRGGEMQVLSLNDLVGDADHPLGELDMSLDWLGVDRALQELEKMSPETGRLVELKFYSGLSTDEIADVLKISRATVVREWRFARAWLADRLNQQGQT
ncbi:RNA polymerase subunit sigma-70 [Ahniella affigens]|uniref:RNA polymerase subunit sigma-70 n=1 Tax=Ahniella affigens TaxID=2021234 RepID=A0A2P1PNP8_9GAMM|nr:ECF-type sigma factor [Ahniella affigens]AVP96468.1 RNA polymerase subunit sigma-70 [Ahniella affigens]